MKLSLVGAVESTDVTLGMLLERGYDPLVLTLPPELGHRHSDYVDLAARYPGHRHRIVGIDRIAAPASVELLRAESPDVLAVFGWSQICPPEVLAVARLATLGCHPAALPRNRGRGVIPWTILQQIDATAFSLFHLADGVDDGDLVVQVPVEVAPRETARTLYDKHLDGLRQALEEMLGHLERTGTLPRLPQDHRLATWCARRDAEDGRLDFHRSAATVDRLIRASTHPYPGAFTTTTAGSTLRIWAAHDVDAAEHWARPGQIVAIEDGRLTVMCGDRRAVVCEDWDVETDDASPPRLHAQLGPRIPGTPPTPA